MERLIRHSRTCFLMKICTMCHSLFGKKKKQTQTFETEASRFLHMHFIRNLISTGAHTDEVHDAKFKVENISA